MINSPWLADDHYVDEVDPGKDIFALLFMSFFLINAVILLCVTRRPEQSVDVVSRPAAAAVSAESGVPAAIVKQGGRIGLAQKNRFYAVPGDLDRMKAEAEFIAVPNPDGPEGRLLVIRNPGKDLNAMELLKLVSAVQGAGISTRFQGGGKDEGP